MASSVGSLKAHGCVPAFARAPQDRFDDRLSEPFASKRRTYIYPPELGNLVRELIQGAAARDMSVVCGQKHPAIRRAFSRDDRGRPLVEKLEHRVDVQSDVTRHRGVPRHDFIEEFLKLRELLRGRRLNDFEHEATLYRLALGTRMRSVSGQRSQLLFELGRCRRMQVGAATVREFSSQAE